VLEDFRKIVRDAELGAQACKAVDRDHIDGNENDVPACREFRFGEAIGETAFAGARLANEKDGRLLCSSNCAWPRRALYDRRSVVFDQVGEAIRGGQPACCPCAKGRDVGAVVRQGLDMHASLGEST